jgi:hypothetical protein
VNARLLYEPFKDVATVRIGHDPQRGLVSDSLLDGVREVFGMDYLGQLVVIHLEDITRVPWPDTWWTIVRQNLIGPTLSRELAEAVTVGHAATTDVALPKDELDSLESQWRTDHRAICSLSHVDAPDAPDPGASRRTTFVGRHVVHPILTRRRVAFLDSEQPAATVVEQLPDSLADALGVEPGLSVTRLDSGRLLMELVPREPTLTSPSIVAVPALGSDPVAFRFADERYVAELSDGDTAVSIEPGRLET